MNPRGQPEDRDRSDRTLVAEMEGRDPDALARLYDRRKNLITNIAAHATFNIVGVILLFGFPRVGT